MTRGYIFDYGGTLDTGGQHWGMAIWHAYERHGVPVTEAQYREAYVYTERILGRQPIIKWAVADDLYERTRTVTAESRRVLRSLKNQDLPMVLVSNFYGNISVVLGEFGFDGLFQTVIESAVVGIRKPDPRIFLLGVEALGLKAEEVSVVGDSLEKDIIPAHKAGCRTVWLSGEGWTPTSHNGDCPFGATADRVIRSLDELLEKE